MADYRRSRQDGGTFFFTVVTHRRRPILVEKAVRQALRQSIEDVRTDMNFEINAWLLLPDHLHCLWTLPENDNDFSKRWGRIKAGVSRRVGNAFSDSAAASRSRRKHHETAFWQRRFREHRIRDRHDYDRHFHYIHYNPVKHGLVNQVADWPWSSFHRYVKQGVYAQDWGGGCDIDGDFGE